MTHNLAHVTNGKPQSGTRRTLLALLDGERIFALGLIIVGIVAVTEGFGYGFIRDDGIIGAGFMPIVFGIVVIACAGQVLLVSLRRGSPRSESLPESLCETTLPEGQEAAPTVKKGSERSALFVCVGIGVALWASGWIGLIPALTLLTLAVLRYVERQGWIKSIVIAVSIGLGAWLIFTRFLLVPLDFGYLGTLLIRA